MTPKPIHIGWPSLCETGFRTRYVGRPLAARRIRNGDTDDLCVDCLTAFEIETSPLGTAS